MTHTIERSALVDYSAPQMYELVNDIEAYPGFMDGCVSAKIIGKEGSQVTARLDIAKAGLKQSFTTRNRLSPPHRIDMALADGPFKVFRGFWEFKPLDESSCKVTFHLEYEFSNFLLGMAARRLIDGMVEEQVSAVCQRAQVIYGSGAP